MSCSNPSQWQSDLFLWGKGEIFLNSRNLVHPGVLLGEFHKKWMPFSKSALKTVLENLFLWKNWNFFFWLLKIPWRLEPYRMDYVKNEYDFRIQHKKLNQEVYFQQKIGTKIFTFQLRRPKTPPCPPHIGTFVDVKRCGI